MDRRSFLTVLGAVGVLTGAPRWLLDPVMRERFAPDMALPDDDDVSEWLEPQDLAVYGRQATYELFAAHGGDALSQPAVVEMLRLPEDGGGTILRWLLSPGSTLRWCAGQGEAILGPVRIITPKLVQAYVVGTDARGRVVYASKDCVVPLYPYQ